LLRGEVRFEAQFQQAAEPLRRRNSQARLQALVVEIGTSLEQRQRQHASDPAKCQSLLQPQPPMSAADAG
jgi:hypothetical protein